RFDTKASAITKKAAEYEDLLGASRFQSVSGNISNTPITWTAPTGTGQTYKIWQRSDIDWNMVRNSKVGDRRFMGKTNAEAARAGVAPELKDGSFATLHHIGQNNNGPLVEATTRLHNFRNPKAFRSLHNQFGKGVKHPTNPVDHNIFAKETSEYWKVRILNEF
ncbi:MAG: hypothetical protein KBD04_02270, partial [Proteobacteria bacterium]|nr:hypothetical protein [Pseudomonadota bacterium]